MYPVPVYSSAIPAHPEITVQIKSFFIIGSAVLASAAFAQASLGTVGPVQGLVTDTIGGNVTSTTPGEQIVDGERFTTCLLYTSPSPRDS